ncbi:MAG: hypothetical protein HYV02_01720 [Deltaproteobacteria bacterium]|nr:hypothetical protein [Deltaproteobacteria bacterium]
MPRLIPSIGHRRPMAGLLENVTMPAITICGYGSQGRAQGQNLAESGWEVTIAVRADGPSHRAAMADGMRVITDLRAAASDAQCCALLVADPAQPAMWETVLRPHLPPAATLIFAHGYHLHWTSGPSPSSRPLHRMPRGADGRRSRRISQRSRKTDTERSPPRWPRRPRQTSSASRCSSVADWRI